MNKDAPLNSFFINRGIYLTSTVIKLKCVSDVCYDNINIGEIYTANTTTDIGYYFIHETQTVLPSKLFIPLDELRETKLNELGIKSL